jgi:large subunit ribosomal protein L6
MSKLGKKPISIPVGVTVTEANGHLEVKGKAGNLSLPVLPYIALTIKDGAVHLTPTLDHKQARANWGTMAALLKNAFEGVTLGFKKVLEIEGIGFRATMEGKNLVLNVGFTHPVKFMPPEGVTITLEKNRITVASVNKEMLGEAAAQIRSIKKPEPYKGKGIRYAGEVIRRKAGKKVAGVIAEK